MARYRSKLPQIFTPISSIGYSGMKILGFFSTILRVALLLLVLLAYGCTRTYVRQTTANAWNSSPATKLRAGMTSAEVSSLLEISLLEKRGWPYINVDPDVWKVEIDSYPLGIFPSGASDARLQSLFLNTLSVYRLPAIANVWAAGLVSWRIDELARQSASKDTVEVWKRAIRLRSFNRPIEVVGSTSVNAHLDHGKLEVSTSDGTAHTTIPLLGRDGRPIEYTYLQHLAVGKWDIKSSKSFGFGAGDPGDLFVLSPLVLSTGPLHLPPHDVYIVPYLKRNRAAREARRQERNEGELQEAVSGAAPNPPRHRIAATWGL